MFYKDEILARLANGEDAQAIADNLANTLNDAIQEHLDSQKAVKEKNEKATRVGIIMTEVLDFLEDFYPDVYDKELRDFDNAELLDLVEDAIEETRNIKKVMNNIDGVLNDILKDLEKPEAKVCKCQPKPEAKRDPIDEFLSKYVNK